VSRMSRAILYWFGLALVGAALPPGVVAGPASPQRALLDKYCVTCHNERLHTAGLMLDRMDVEDIGGGAEVWEKVLLKLGTGAMPPAGMPRPDQGTLDTFASWLKTSLDHVAMAEPNPGRVGIHRLNQVEYTNAIRDLLALDIDGRSLLGTDDAGENGFDNMAGSLTVSPSLIERYLGAAQKVSRLAIGDPKVVPVFETHSILKELSQDGRISEDLPFGSHGGIAVHYRFPVDGEYTVKIQLRGQLYQYIIGLGRRHEIEVRVDGRRIKLFTVGGDAPGRPAPTSFAGDILGDPEWEKYMHSADAGLQVRFPARAGTRVVGISFVGDTAEPEGVAQPVQTMGTGLTFNEFYDGNAVIEKVSIGGPFRVQGSGDTPSRRRVFVCRPTSGADEEPCARKILLTVARRAYRRPVNEEDLRPLLRFYEAARKGGSFDSGIQSALQRVLIDPEFIFRIERDPPNSIPGAVYRLSDLELASRLSFFLWSSIPDDELLDLAIRKELRLPEILQKQVRRMFADSRSKALAENFANQWLEMPKLIGATPDPDAFPDFDENLRAAFQQETELFIESQLRGDRSVVELLSANYTFVNERLAQHYQIPNIYGDGFRRVSFNSGERGGLLGEGGILTVTSYANRTSPVLRGKWLLANILGTPPPPPPPNVPPLPENSANSKPTSVRERLEEHRKNPTCAACHLRMDPLGFTLENFDAIGQWHATSREGIKIDSVGDLPDGTKLDGVTGLRNLLLSRREQFVGAFTEKLLAWALGRGVEYYDMPAVRKIVREAAPDDYRWTALIEGIVKSVPFQMGVVKGAPSQTARGNKTPRKNVAERQIEVRK
jgi:Protein of unknown function (DUF1592)/Protein of unknown function (DUF1588)/Protein of unknown function (DUF1585)/Protein of unknown function (DUF1595)/Protein of unknown function (DUF1587)